VKRDAVYKIVRNVIPGYDAVSALTHRAVAALLIGKKPERHLRRLGSTFNLKRHRKDRRFERLTEALDAYVRLGRDLRLGLPLDFWWARPFEMKVYNALRKTVAGETVSYGELARRIGHPRHARQVGRALGRNMILIAVPCHRVLNRDRTLGGFTGGLELKSRLLGIERQSDEELSPLALAER
jgi:AraC family transcriptional regulator of adaptative response/methylated-DNA-[protein]-cysteine methyltransferase